MLVMCSDVNIYVCKYMRSSATAYKLACELIGAKLAKAWRLTTPDIALVNIRPLHWEGINIADRLKTDYDDCLHKCGFSSKEVFDEMPKEWKVPSEVLTEKLHQLFDEHWTAAVWENYMSCLNENIG